MIRRKIKKKVIYHIGPIDEYKIVQNSNLQRQGS